jgi:hypothetical protein
MTTIQDFTPDGTGIAEMLRWWQPAELRLAGLTLM